MALRTLTLALAILAVPAGALAQPAPPVPRPDAPAADASAPEETGAEDTAARFCEFVEKSANAYGLPVAFFTRLLWKESRFRSDAVSPKGAEGIAQFMPGTARERGLADPFDPRLAIPASAHLLAELRLRFGNLGLAAAAYNAGADRVERWLAGTSLLPLETIDYVLSITGLSADDWAAEAEPPVDGKAPEDCLALTAYLKVPGNALEPALSTSWAPWGVQVSGNFSRARALSAYSGLQRRFPALLGERDPMVVGGRMRGRGTRPFYRVRVPAESRSEAAGICAKLRAAGAACIVLKS